MALGDKCYVCGDCWWQECQNDADYSHDVDLKRGGLPVFAGKVELCGGHSQLALRTGRMDIKWEAIEQALSVQAARA